ncbi:MAG: hypothetical protein KatS3mg038_3726 [Candidatus Kapaibacterium sp.]|nr:MAG: hypothetical protein KatS3mg038_2328 [Candidatus Kapabacteria bacterium]GIV53205.1 MAG: hypothetical protein KatS3mg038_3726 [Candidatus Kapabacteria bacterium]
MNHRQAYRQIRYLRTRTRWTDYAPLRLEKAIKVIRALATKRDGWTVYDVQRVLGCSRQIALRVTRLLTSSRVARLVNKGGGKHNATIYRWTIDILEDTEATESDLVIFSDDHNVTLTTVVSDLTNQSEENKRCRNVENRKKAKAKRKRKCKDILEDIKTKPHLLKEPLKEGYPYWRDIMRRLRTGLAAHNVAPSLVQETCRRVAAMLRHAQLTVGQAINYVTALYRTLVQQVRLTSRRVYWLISNILRTITGRKQPHGRKQVDTYYEDPHWKRTSTRKHTSNKAATTNNQHLLRKREEIIDAPSELKYLITALVDRLSAHPSTQPQQPERKMTTQQVMDWYHHLKTRHAPHT